VPGNRFGVERTRPREAALLAGIHRVPVLLQTVERFIWHQLCSGALHQSFPRTAAKDLRQVATRVARW
jgi:hypothetical protein